MNRRQTMLFGLSGCAGVLAMPVRKLNRSKADLMDSIKEIQEVGDRMWANRYEIYKKNNKYLGKGITDRLERDLLMAEFTEMIEDRVRTTVNGNYIGLHDETLVYMGFIGSMNITFNFKLHSNDKINHLSKQA